MKQGGVSEILVAVVLAAMVTFVIADLAGGLGTFPNERWASAVAAMCLAAWIGPGALRRYAGNASGALKAVALWLVIACAIAFLFVYGKDFLVSMGVNLV